jgi:hypothetical protein
MYIPFFVEVLGRHGPIIQRQFKTQSESIYSRGERSRLAHHNNHRLQGRKKSGKSRFDEEKAAINLQLRSKHSCDTKKSNSPGAKKPRPPGAKKTARQRLMPVIPSPH